MLIELLSLHCFTSVNAILSYPPSSSLTSSEWPFLNKLTNIKLLALWILRMQPRICLSTLLWTIFQLWIITKKLRQRSCCLQHSLLQHLSSTRHLVFLPGEPLWTEEPSGLQGERKKKNEDVSCSVVSDSCDPMDCSPPSSSVHGDSPGKNTRVGNHSLHQGIFPTQGWNLGLQHCRQILYHLSHQGGMVSYGQFSIHIWSLRESWRFGSLQHRWQVWPAVPMPHSYPMGPFIICVHVSSWHVLCDSLSDVTLRLPEPISPVNTRTRSTWNVFLSQQWWQVLEHLHSGLLAPDGDHSEADPHCLQSIPV